MDQIDSMANAWMKGNVCLHPTDTLPGLSFNPKSIEARKSLAEIKKRDESKTCICLVSSLEMAKEFWLPLPGKWGTVLRGIWPAPLSVIWKASDSCPQELVRADGSIAFRVPLLSAENTWILEAIKKVDSPFPTTSVNESGNLPAGDWQQAKEFLAGKENSWLPSVPFDVPGGAPSTIVLIESATQFKVVRQGACDIDGLKEQL